MLEYTPTNPLLLDIAESTNDLYIQFKYTYPDTNVQQQMDIAICDDNEPEFMQLMFEQPKYKIRLATYNLKQSFIQSNYMLTVMDVKQAMLCGIV